MGPSASETPHGHYLGGAIINGRIHFAEALVAVDGAVRIYVGGLWGDGSYGSGAGPPASIANPEESTLFVGSLDVTEGARATGSGVTIGQVCREPITGRFCTQPAASTVMIEGVRQDHLLNIAGELTVATDTGVESWVLDLTEWSAYYPSGARLDWEAALAERLAPFAQGGDVVINIDSVGQMSFESPQTGCRGDGALSPHLDGRFGVYDVVLSIDGCNPDYAYLNADFEGLATETQSCIWCYDSAFVAFLSAPDGPPPRPAVNLRAYPCHEPGADGSGDDPWCQPGSSPEEPGDWD